MRPSRARKTVATMVCALSTLGLLWMLDELDPSVLSGPARVAAASQQESTLRVAPREFRAAPVGPAVDGAGREDLQEPIPCEPAWVQQPLPQKDLPVDAPQPKRVAGWIGPEPATLALVLLGGAAAMQVARRRRSC